MTDEAQAGNDLYATFDTTLEKDDRPREKVVINKLTITTTQP